MTSRTSYRAACAAMLCVILSTVPTSAVVRTCQKNTNTPTNLDATNPTAQVLVGAATLPFATSLALTCVTFDVAEENPEGGACKATNPASTFKARLVVLKSGSVVSAIPIESMNAGSLRTTVINLPVVDPAMLAEVWSWALQFSATGFDPDPACKLLVNYGYSAVRRDDTITQAFPVIETMTPALLLESKEVTLTFMSGNGETLGAYLVATSASEDCTGATFPDSAPTDIKFTLQPGFTHFCGQMGAEVKLLGSAYVPGPGTYLTSVMCSGSAILASGSPCSITLKGVSQGGDVLKGVAISGLADSCTSDTALFTSDPMLGGKKDEVVTVTTSSVKIENDARICLRHGGVWHDTINEASLPTEVVAVIPLNQDGTASATSDGRIVPGLSNLFFGLIIGGVVLLIGIVVLAVWALCCRAQPAQANANFKPL